MRSIARAVHDLLTLSRVLRAALGPRPRPSPTAPAVDALLERARAAGAAGRAEEARDLLEQARRAGSRDGGRLAAIHYELGRLDAERGRLATAVAHWKSALRADRTFVPAALALGDAQEASGDLREALRTWERAAEADPALPLLGRLERIYRNDGRPSRMIALYREAAARAPDNLAIAVALGRVYFELEMLDEAADQLETVEVRAPEVPIVHALLAAVFERRGQAREAFDEYRRALRLAHAFEWPHACRACGASAAAWADRCPRCLHPNTVRPVASTP